MEFIYGPTRTSIRLKDFDYSSAGAYFVTICTQDRACLFGDVIDGNMVLSDVGRMVESAWECTTQYAPGITLDEFTVMPNHLHGIVIIEPPISGQARGISGRGQCPAPTVTLSSIIGRFKSWTTHEYRVGRHLWQRNYFERVIRNEKELNHVREYIRNNPAQWELDDENPAFQP